jgi:outer membrane protein assembly factor BamB
MLLWSYIAKNDTSRPSIQSAESIMKSRQPFLSNTFVLKLIIVIAAMLSHARAGDILDWPSWRGANNHGSVEQGSYPATFEPRAARWRAELPGKGCSTPIVWKERIYLTAPADGKDAALALDANGKLLWTTSFGPEVKGKHKNGSGSNSSPVTDGNSLFVYFKSGTLAALDLNGKEVWKHDITAEYGQENMFWDYGTSPVLTQKFVILVRMHSGDSWIAAFDKANGKLAWKVARNYEVPTEVDQCYTTPLVINHQGQEAILTWGAEHLTIHAASDGKLIWSCGGFNPEANRLWPAIATPVISQQHAVIAFGRNDRGIPLLFGIKLSGQGDVTKTNQVWKRTDVGTFVPTPIVYRDRVYVVGDQGEVECLDPTSGKTVWKNQLPKNRNKFYASPLIAGDKLYAIREDGVVFVANIAADQYMLESENDMQESIIGSPIPLGNSLLLRGEKTLFCVGNR